ncbi:hypothetical protein NE237_013361 [Protea cynaroides]|uniref:Uncharacterized protein n=1 Tax=Protea cynaroides TaxID=273540 RepID=A0A9Q0GZ68_9MAGN|nr:hypothetical protein NE237_013361 [Protea cynaroides]
MVLKDIPDEKTVTFSVKVFLPNGVKELVLGSDFDVLQMFRDDHAVDEEVEDKEVRDDDSVDSKWGKDGIEVGDDDSTNNEKDLEGDDNMGGVVDYDKDSDGKLSDCKSDDSPDEIDCWVDRNIDHTKRIKMKRKKVAKKVDGISSSPMQTRLQKYATPNSTNIQAKLKEKKVEKAEKNRKRAKTNDGRVR